MTQLRKNLRAIFMDGVYYAVMVGLGESYLATFVLALGLEEVTTGLLSTVPIFVGSSAQLFTPWLSGHFSSPRRWVLTCGTLQALCFLPLISAAIFGWGPRAFLLVVFSCYWAFGMAGGPVWSTWVEALVPRRLRARYFARRSLWMYVGVFGGFAGAGLLLQGAKTLHQELWGFAILFAAGTAARFGSLINLSRQSNAPPPPPPPGAIFERVQRMFRGRQGLFIFYMLGTQFAVQVSGPYFTPYMFRELKITYYEFVPLLAGPILARVAVVMWQGDLAKRLGASRLLWWGGLGIVPVSALWAVSTSYTYLLVSQIVAGVAWSAYELGAFLLIFEAVPARDRTWMLAIFNFLNALMIAAGAALGGTILDALGKDMSAYFRLFIISSVLRTLPLFLLYELRNYSVPATVPAARGVSARPSVGLGSPFLANLIGRRYRGERKKK